MPSSIPVLTYHSIALDRRMDPARFEAHLRVLASCGLPSLLPADLASAKRGFLLTFDDGFADLWTHGLPFLRKHGLKALVFAIPSRAGEGEPRPQGCLAWTGSPGNAMGEASRRPGPHDGFLRWSELAALEASGLVEVHSHSQTHSAGWVGKEIRGFHLGKAHWSLAQATGGDERLGIPLYRRGSALAHRLYFDDPELRDALAAWLERRGGAQYVQERGAKAVERELWEEVRRRQGSHPSGGRWEEEAERQRRTAEEIVAGRQALEARLGGRRDELCLPWGEYDAVTLDCARTAGIRRVYTLARGPNPSGRMGFLVNRFEPRHRGPLWLRSRLWLYRSTVRARLYAALRA